MNGNEQHLQELDLIIQALLDQVQEHAHKCEYCSHVWRHTGMNAGNEQAHKCPQCHTGPYWERL